MTCQATLVPDIDSIITASKITAWPVCFVGYNKLQDNFSLWLIGQGGWKLPHRPGFNSWQFPAQAEKCCWALAGNWKFLTFFYLIF